jgi:ribonuclease D
MSSLDKGPWTWVDSPLKGRSAARDIEASAVLCIDTEYDSFRYFRDKLCLIQIKAARRTYLFDPFNGTDISFLAGPFAHPGVVKVLHAGDNDIRLLKRDYGFGFKNVFDTHRAAAVLGCRFLSLSTLIAQHLGVDLVKKKKIQRSQWDKRPLTEEQLRYAVLDTAYLTPLYDKLSADLRGLGLEKQARRAFADVAAGTWQEKTLDVQGHRKIKAYAFLESDQKTALKRLYRWRFQKARDTNRAVFMILSDQELVNLACVADPSRITLKKEGGLSAEKADRYSEEIIRALRSRASV